MRRALVLVALCLPAFAAGKRADLSWAKSWCCWLQEPSIDALAESSFDVVVMDYSRDGSASGEFSKTDIAKLRKAGKTVLAYFSIGEAEDYRFYWKKSWKPGKPGFLDEENPDWPGNYAVEFWTSGWWSNALEPYLDRILAAGFDGVYLDKVDAYWWWYDVKGVHYRTSANRMVALVEKIASYARAKAGEQFIVCPQNGEAILDDASSAYRKRYLAAIDAVGAESIYYNTWSEEDAEYRLAKLEQFDAAGKRILVLEYIDEEDRDELQGLIGDSGLDMIGYAADPDRMLDELVE
jgi:cysteinyl-tRNA synthetase